jgi:N-acetylneuraminate synthase
MEELAPVTAHLHIADASGVDGEGLQIGDGEIDFGVLMKKLAQIMPNASFIPEIWQGHKNKGQGFWVALDRLERYCGK